MVCSMPPTYKRKKSIVDQWDRKPLGPADSLPTLTEKQERFALAILEGKRPLDAYREAYADNAMSSASASVESSRLQRNAKIAAYISWHQRRGLSRVGCNIENHLAQLERLRELAIDNAQISAGVQAEHYRGRVAGFYEDKLRLSVGPTDEALLAQISQFSPDIARALASQLGSESSQVIDITPKNEDDKSL